MKSLLQREDLIKEIDTNSHPTSVHYRHYTPESYSLFVLQFSFSTRLLRKRWFLHVQIPFHRSFIPTLLSTPFIVRLVSCFSLRPLSPSVPRNLSRLYKDSLIFWCTYTFRHVYGFFLVSSGTREWRPTVAQRHVHPPLPITSTFHGLTYNFRAGWYTYLWELFLTL